MSYEVTLRFQNPLISWGHAKDIVSGDKFGLIYSHIFGYLELPLLSWKECTSTEERNRPPAEWMPGCECDIHE